MIFNNYKIFLKPYLIFIKEMQSSKILLLSLVLTILNSCSAFNNFSGRISTTQSHYTESIFLSPEALKSKKLYLYYKNSTIYSDFNLEDKIKESYKNKEFTFTTPEEATLIVQVNLKYYGVFDKELLNSIIEDTSKKVFIAKSINDNESDKKITEFTKEKKKLNIDFSGFVIGGVGGFLIFQNLIGAFVTSGIVGAGAIFLDKYYEGRTVICLVDVQVLEKTSESVKIYEFAQINNADGSIKKMEIEENSNYKIQNTKIIIASKGSNMQDANAIQSIKKQLIASISNIL